MESTDNNTSRQPLGLASNEGLCPLRAAADAVMAHQWSNNREAMDALTRLIDAAHALAVDVAAERKRCAKPVPDEWLAKVRRLMAGFEHVSNLARMWEPDYSSGSERVLWARAAEAYADMAKLLRAYEKA